MVVSILAALAALPLTQPAEILAPLQSQAMVGSWVAVSVTDLAGTPKLELNSSLRMVPASNQKLLSAAFALDTLGPEWRPETRIWRLSSRTVVQSSGDPLMTHERLREAVERLRVDTRNPVYVSHTYGPIWPDSWEFDDLPFRYAAPISAFTVDRSSFELWAQDGRLRLEPRSYGIRIDHRSGPGPLQATYDPVRRRVDAQGLIPTSRTRIHTFSLARPDAAAASWLGSRFVTAKRLPESPPTGILQGNTTLELLRACLPTSDNNIAENLMLMGAQRLEPLGELPYAVARRRMTEFLTQEVGVAETDVRVMDGSGMSRHNQVTARAMTQLLTWAARQPTADAWRQSLAKPGTGTLSTRLTGIEFAGKTGTLNLVATLSGYVQTAFGEELAVSVLINHHNGDAQAARGAIDAFLQNLVRSQLKSGLTIQRSVSSAVSSNQVDGRPSLDRLY